MLTCQKFGNKQSIPNGGHKQVNEYCIYAENRFEMCINQHKMRDEEDEEAGKTRRHFYDTQHNIVILLVDCRIVAEKKNHFKLS